MFLTRAGAHCSGLDVFWFHLPQEACQNCQPLHGFYRLHPALAPTSTRPCLFFWMFVFVFVFVFSVVVRLKLCTRR